jgi:hypothetical protein
MCLYLVLLRVITQRRATRLKKKRNRLRRNKISLHLNERGYLEVLGTDG